jgi:hypothetical protein
MSDKNTISINVKFDSNLDLLDIYHVFKDKNGNEKSKKIKKKDKFKMDFDKIHKISNMTLVKGDVAGVDPYCIVFGGTLYCFP